ncbi:hypothetical protein [Micromonospora sp. KC723]|uniref:hypothetical protein n=1 Tax=Micromonospora sp. KC723 TaxID=2530381 RepID=UPI001405212D|nr:hypothetical protein [Micromonospora sp. KC723]
MPAVPAPLNNEAVSVAVRPWFQAVDWLGKKLAERLPRRLDVVHPARNQAVPA